MTLSDLEGHSNYFKPLISCKCRLYTKGLPAKSLLKIVEISWDKVILSESTTTVETAPDQTTIRLEFASLIANILLSYYHSEFIDILQVIWLQNVELKAVTQWR